MIDDITKKKIRIVTAASLFDGHDAAINIMRRILQSKGAEIIHLGHNRSVHEIVECAIEEDVQGIAVTSYQGGHIEFFKYMKDLLDENGCGHIKIFGGGGGTILPREIEELQAYGISKIYSPDDGRTMGLEGMIEDVIRKCSLPLTPSKRGGTANSTHLNGKYALGEWRDIKKVAISITEAENGKPVDILNEMNTQNSADSQSSRVKDKQVKRSGNVGGSRGAAVLGITGTGGAGKSSVTDEIVRRFLNNYPGKTIAVLSVDPSRKKTGGAL
ncbi:MAG: cobalamin-dependent protein, partial [Bacteroidota bacterium]|nr:cobalamin-dependent protein [Bacteroidota bacterium]